MEQLESINPIFIRNKTFFLNHELIGRINRELLDPLIEQNKKYGQCDEYRLLCSLDNFVLEKSVKLGELIWMFRNGLTNDYNARIFKLYESELERSKKNILDFQRECYRKFISFLPNQTLNSITNVTRSPEENEELFLRLTETEDGDNFLYSVANLPYTGVKNCINEFKKLT